MDDEKRHADQCSPPRSNNPGVQPVSVGVNRTLIIVVGVVFLAVAAFVVLNRPQLQVVHADLPAEFPENGFSHESLERLLRKYVDAQGDVNYSAWHANPQDLLALESYLAAVSHFSPDATPQRFVERNDALAYWIYGYNAYVIWSILQRWPIASVTDIKAPLEIVNGLGFFYRQRFLFGAKPYSLYAVENDRIRDGFKDPRIHFVLNCASQSCPVLRRELPSGDALEPMLQAATLEFVGDPRNVRIDHDSQSIVLSTIFRWFRSDFINDLMRRGLSTERGPLAYVIDAAPEPLKQSLLEASGYEIRYADYDWAINSQAAPEN
jgi:hypothetical protein